MAVACACGARLKVKVELRGRKVTCPKCKAPVVVRPIPKPKPPPAPVAAVPEAAPRSRASYLLMLALVPLAVSAAMPADGLDTRIDRMLKGNPQLSARVYDRTKETGRPLETEDLLDLVPGARIEGALHGRATVMHWLYATGAAIGFWCFARFAFPPGRLTGGQFWKAGFLSAMGCLVLLKVVQALGALAPGVVFWIYAAAAEPTSGLGTSLLGFTFGVGLLEELVKALPVMWHMKKKGTLDAAGATLWGLAAGIGGGAVEGILYCSDFHNGIGPGSIYLVRFTTGVALQAVWSGAAALLVWRFQEQLRGNTAVPTAAKVLGGVVVLHGLTDTFLKRDLAIAALVTAAVSVVGFFVLTEWARRPSVLAAVPPPRTVSEEDGSVPR